MLDRPGKTSKILGVGMRETRRERLDYADEVRKRQAAVSHIPVVVKRASDVAIPASAYIRLNAAQDNLRKEAFLTFIKGLAKICRKNGIYSSQSLALEGLSDRLRFNNYNDLISFLDSEAYESYPWDEARALKAEILEGIKGGINRSSPH